MRRLILAAAPLLLLASPAYADVDDDAEVWLTLATTGTISGRLLGQADTNARFSHDDDRIYEAQLGGLLGYKLSDRVSLWAGYVRIARYRNGAATTVENRTRQQITADLARPFGGKLAGRLRLEQRFRSGAETGWRLRSQLKYSRPFHKDGPSLVLSHESFLPLNDTAFQRSRYERMRNFAGVSFPVVKKLTAEVGYLNQYTFRTGRDLDDHILATTLNYAF